MDAYAVKCPGCGAKPGEPCTYMPLAVVPAKYAMTSQTRDKLARVGQPTKVPHNDRRNEASRIEVQRFHKERMKRQQVVRPSPAIVAVRAYDQAEWDAMRTFLRTAGPILWSPIALCHFGSVRGRAVR